MIEDRSRRLTAWNCDGGGIQQVVEATESSTAAGVFFVEHPEAQEVQVWAVGTKAGRLRFGRRLHEPPAEVAAEDLVPPRRSDEACCWSPKGKPTKQCQCGRPMCEECALVGQCSRC